MSSREVSYQEIAETLKVPIGTVTSWLSRGKTQLRAAIACESSGVTAKVVPFASGLGRKPA